jgi:hypothetical protein
MGEFCRDSPCCERDNSLALINLYDIFMSTVLFDRRLSTRRDADSSPIAIRCAFTAFRRTTRRHFLYPAIRPV